MLFHLFFILFFNDLFFRFKVRLPENEVTLVAYVVPIAIEGQKYQYEWTLLKQPAGTNTIKVQNEERLHLSKLSEGLYTFKVMSFFS